MKKHRWQHPIHTKIKTKNNSSSKTLAPQSNCNGEDEETKVPGGYDFLFLENKQHAVVPLELLDILEPLGPFFRTIGNFHYKIFFVYLNRKFVLDKRINFLFGSHINREYPRGQG